MLVLKSYMWKTTCNTHLVIHEICIKFVKKIQTMFPRFVQDLTKCANVILGRLYEGRWISLSGLRTTSPRKQCFQVWPTKTQSNNQRSRLFSLSLYSHHSVHGVRSNPQISQSHARKLIVISFICDPFPVTFSLGMLAIIKCFSRDVCVDFSDFSLMIANTASIVSFRTRV